MSEERTLTDKQRMFILEYVKDFNATQAAKRAGYSEKTAGAIGHELLKKLEIRAALKAYYEEHAMGEDEIGYHLAKIARGDIGDMVNDFGIPDISAAKQRNVSNLIRRIKRKTITGEDNDIQEDELEMYDRLKALELLGKIHALFTDKSAVDMTTGGKPLNGLIINLGDDERATD